MNITEAEIQKLLNKEIKDLTENDLEYLMQAMLAFKKDGEELIPYVNKIISMLPEQQQVIMKKYQLVTSYLLQISGTVLQKESDIIDEMCQQDIDSIDERMKRYNEK